MACRLSAEEQQAAAQVQELSCQEDEDPPPGYPSLPSRQQSPHSPPSVASQPSVLSQRSIKSQPSMLSQPSMRSQQSALSSQRSMPQQRGAAQQLITQRSVSRMPTVGRMGAATSGIGRTGSVRPGQMLTSEEGSDPDGPGSGEGNHGVGTCPLRPIASVVLGCCMQLEMSGFLPGSTQQLLLLLGSSRGVLDRMQS